MTYLEYGFIGSAVVGGIFVVGQFIMQMMGLDSDNSDGLDFDNHSDSDMGFHILSIQGFSTFLFMFGLTGMALHFNGVFGAFFSITGSVVSGVASVFIVSKLFGIFLKMQSSGSISNDTLEGSTGTVYLPIKEGKLGRVTINQNNRQRELDAVSLDKEDIEVGEPIQVVSHSGSVVTVVKIR